MVVVAILATLATIAARLSSKGPRGDKSGAFARQLVIAAHEARETAISLGATTRLRMVSAASANAVGGTNRIVTERLDPTTNQWVPLGGGAVAPSGAELCNVSAQVVLSGAQPVCPSTVDARICFGPTGRVSVPTTPTSDVCPTTGAGTGATLFARTTDGTVNAKQYKLLLYRLTGAARLADRW